MPTRDEDDALSPEVLAAAEELRKKEGVVGVFWGDRYKDGRWIPERTLCVHVQKKRQKDALAASEFIQPTFRGFRTDVLEVGRIVAHAAAIGVSDTVCAVEPSPRKSTVTAIARFNDAPHVLVSGHGTLPMEANRIRSSYLSREYENVYKGSEDLSLSGQDVWVEFQDKELGHVRGQLVCGKLGKSGAVDFALVRLNSSIPAATKHPMPKTDTPLPVAHVPNKGDKLIHHSRLTRTERPGEFHSQAASKFEVWLPDGSSHFYNHAYIVEGTDGTFSQPGDSGSAVFHNKKIMGTVLGGCTANPRISYILPIRFLGRYINAAIYKKFFSEE